MLWLVSCDPGLRVPVLLCIFMIVSPLCCCRCVQFVVWRRTILYCITWCYCCINVVFIYVSYLVCIFVYSVVFILVMSEWDQASGSEARSCVAQNWVTVISLTCNVQVLVLEPWLLNNNSGFVDCHTYYGFPILRLLFYIKIIPKMTYNVSSVMLSFTHSLTSVLRLLSDSCKLMLGFMWHFEVVAPADNIMIAESWEVLMLRLICSLRFPCLVLVIRPQILDNNSCCMSVEHPCYLNLALFVPNFVVVLEMFWVCSRGCTGSFQMHKHS